MSRPANTTTTTTTTTTTPTPAPRPLNTTVTTTTTTNTTRPANSTVTPATNMTRPANTTAAIKSTSYNSGSDADWWGNLFEYYWANWLFGLHRVLIAWWYIPITAILFNDYDELFNLYTSTTAGFYPNV